MKIKLDQKLVDLDGKVIPDGEKDSILRNFLVDCLTRVHVAYQNGQAIPEQLDGKEKFERYELARKIKNAKSEIEAKSEEITKLKELSGKVYSPIFVGAIWEMLEGKEPTEDEVKSEKELIPENAVIPELEGEPVEETVEPIAE